MVRKYPETELPPQHHFSLSHILTHSPNGLKDLKNINDNINTTVTAYTNDISEQLTSLANVETELLNKLQHVNNIYDVVHNIRVESIGNLQLVDNKDIKKNNLKNKSKGYKLSSMFRIPNRNSNNRAQQYKEIDNNFIELLDETVVQKKRINGLLDRLKKIELNFSKRERLFDEKSPNKVHYSKLYNYDMIQNNINKKINNVKKEPINVKVEPNILKSETNDLKVKPFQPEPQTSENIKQERSNSSIKSEISPKKLNQYLDIENELEEIQNIRSNESFALSSSPSSNKHNFNPVTLISKERPTCKINNEKITINPNSSNDPKLINELKKLYN